MYVRVAAILFPITLLAFLGAAIWGYQEYNDKNALLIKAENQYQRAFHDLNYHMDKLQGELGKSIALNTDKQLSKSMTNVWRIAYVAQSDIGQLPLSLMPFDKAEQFLARVGRFAYQVGVRDLNQKPLSDQEWKTLNTLYEQSESLRNDLETVQTKVLSNNLRWLDVEQAIASEDKNMDNTIIDGFKKVNLKAEQFPEVDWGPTINNMEVRQRERDKRLKGPRITAEQAKQRVASAFGKPSTRGMKAEISRKGDFEAYSIRYTGANQTEVYADVTVKGGYLVWMDYDREVKQRKLDYNQALDRAKRFLDRLGYRNMVPISYDEAGNTVAFSFVHRENGVSIYPEAAVVKVALDNGEIMGLQADEYVFNRLDRVQAKPRLTETQAKKKLNRHLKVQKSNLAVIYNDEGKEVLCHEFLGTINRSQYRIFINAVTGEEEMVEKIEKARASTV